MFYPSSFYLAVIEEEYSHNFVQSQSGNIAIKQPLITVSKMFLYLLGIHKLTVKVQVGTVVTRVASCSNVVCVRIPFRCSNHLDGLLARFVKYQYICCHIRFMSVTELLRCAKVGKALRS